MEQDATLTPKRRLDLLQGALDGAPRVWVLVHDSPDPDAMAGGWCARGIIGERFGLECEVVYGGVIGRPENRAMVELLEIPLWHIESISPEPEDRFVTVDTQPGFGNNALPKGATVAAVIDHHPPSEPVSAPLVDVRPDYGAVGTMLAEYAVAAGLPLTGPLSTALAYAILTETSDLGREVSEADLKLYTQLLPRVDHKLLGRLRHPRMERDFYATLHRGLLQARLHRDVVACHLGAVGNVDEVARLADILNALAGSRWVLCTGVYAGVMILSLRTSDQQCNAGRVLERAVGHRGGAGGHGMVAGGQVPMPDEKDRDALEQKLTGSVLAELGYDKNAPFEPLLPDQHVNP